MAIRACFEIGHEAAIRAKRPSEVFTHDWEVFVRGVDNADISQFVEKVVFQLHDTFPKPKRVVKDPPYCVRESGYAGFTLPIEIHLKNRDEPKKIKFTYELTLQHSGPAIIRVQKEKYVFNSPSEEFRRKLLKGGAVIQPNNTNHYLPPHLNIDLERNSRDSFPDEKTSQMMSKPKFGSDIAKKHKTKEYRLDDMPRSSNSFENLFGTPIHKTSTISPDPKKPSPNPKSDKKDKEKSHKDIEKQKLKYEIKEKDHREEKKIKDAEKEKSKEDKKQKSHKERDNKEMSLKRERPVSPMPQAKRPYIPPVHSPPRGPSPNNKSNSSVSSKEESKIVKVDENRSKLNKSSDSNPDKVDKKSKKEKKNHDKERESKKEHKKESKISNHESRDVKSKEVLKEAILRESSKEIKPRPEKVINKFSAENFLKEPVEKYQPLENIKHKDKSDRERKHKHKKKDKKRDESNDKNKDSSHKDKKHKHDKHKNKVIEVKNSPALSDRIESVPMSREPERKEIQTPKIFKEKERSQLTISPISLDTSSQSSSKSVSKHSKMKNPLGSLIEDLPNTSSSNSDISSSSDSEELSFGTDTSKKSVKVEPPPPPPKPVMPEPKPQRQEMIQKPQKSKDKIKESREEKKQRKRKSSTKGDESDMVIKAPKVEEPEPIPKIKNIESFHKTKENSSRVRTEKVQDDGVSSSLTDTLVKCESPVNIIDNGVPERNEINSDYIMQLQELQQRIMTIQSSEELDRIVKLIENTGKYEVTKKTFDFDLCSLDRNTVQQLQELINCESRA